MPISLVRVDDLQEHMMGVLRRSDHHAGDVNEVLLTIAGAILWRKSRLEPVKVNTKEGAGGNVIWFKVDGSRYALLYNHVDRRIELNEGGRKGDLIHTFTNETSTAEVVRVFAGLGEGVLELSKSRKVRKDEKTVEERQQLRQERQARQAERDQKIQARREERKGLRQAEKAEAPEPAEKPAKPEKAAKVTAKAQQKAHKPKKPNGRAAASAAAMPAA